MNRDKQINETHLFELCYHYKNLREEFQAT